MRRGGGKLRRIKHDQIKASRLIPHLAQHLEDIALDAFGHGQLIARCVTTQNLQRRSRTINSGDTLRTALQRVNGKAAAIGKTIEHLATRRQCA